MKSRSLTWMAWMRSIRFAFVLVTSYTENGWMFRRVTQLNWRIASRSTKKSPAGTRLYTLHANFRSFLLPRENMSDTSANWPVQNCPWSVSVRHVARRSFYEMTKHECRMTKEHRMTKFEGVPRFAERFSSFLLRH